MTRSLKLARFLAGALALVVGLTLAAPPAFPAEAATAASPRPIAASATGKVEALPAAALAQADPAAQATPPPATSDETTDKPFFKTRKGAIALVLIAGSLGYTFYSLSNDRVHSPAK